MLPTGRLPTKPPVSIRKLILRRRPKGSKAEGYSWHGQVDWAWWFGRDRFPTVMLQDQQRSRTSIYLSLIVLSYCRDCSVEQTVTESSQLMIDAISLRIMCIFTIVYPLPKGSQQLQLCASLHKSYRRKATLYEAIETSLECSCYLQKPIYLIVYPSSAWRMRKFMALPRSLNVVGCLKSYWMVVSTEWRSPEECPIINRWIKGARCSVRIRRVGGTPRLRTNLRHRGRAFDNRSDRTLEDSACSVNEFRKYLIIWKLRR